MSSIVPSDAVVAGVVVAGAAAIVAVIDGAIVAGTAAIIGITATAVIAAGAAAVVAVIAACAPGEETAVLICIWILAVSVTRAGSPVLTTSSVATIPAWSVESLLVHIFLTGRPFWCIP